MIKQFQHFLLKREFTKDFQIIQSKILTHKQNHKIEGISSSQKTLAKTEAPETNSEDELILLLTNDIMPVFHSLKKQKNIGTYIPLFSKYKKTFSTISKTIDYSYLYLDTLTEEVIARYMVILKDFVDDFRKIFIAQPNPLRTSYFTKSGISEMKKKEIKTDINNILDMEIDLIKNILS